MADTKISALPSSTTPLAGTEVLPVVQSSTTKQVSVANLTAGRTVSGTSFAAGTASSTITLGSTGVTASGSNTNIDITVNPKGTGSGVVNSTTSVSSSDYYGSSTWSFKLTPLVLNAGAGVLFNGLSSGGAPTNASVHVVPVADYRSGLIATYSADGSGSGYFAINQFSPAAATTYQRVKVDVNGDVTFGQGNLIQGTSGKGVTTSGSFALGLGTNGSTSQVTINSDSSVSAITGSFNNVGTAQTITINDTNGGYVVITGVQGGVGSSTWTLPFVKRSGSLAIGTASKAILTADPISSVTVSSNNISVTPLAANTYITFAIYYTPLGA